MQLFWVYVKKQQFSLLCDCNNFVCTKWNCFDFTKKKTFLTAFWMQRFYLNKMQLFWIFIRNHNFHCSLIETILFVQNAALLSAQKATILTPFWMQRFCWNKMQLFWIYINATILIVQNASVLSLRKKRQLSLLSDCNVFVCSWFEFT